MNKFQLEIVAISHSVSTNQTYAVVLGEMNGLRKIPIVIGPFEAQAIAVAIEKLKPTRPLTHDLLKNVILELGTLEEVLIYKLQEGIFYSQLIIITDDGRHLEIDSRTSDALALAVRFGAPIYTYESILESSSTKYRNLSDPSEEGDDHEIVDLMNEITDTDDIKLLTLDELEEKLSHALENEDYALAAELRDEINIRKNQS